MDNQPCNFDEQSLTALVAMTHRRMHKVLGVALVRQISSTAETTIAGQAPAMSLTPEQWRVLCAVERQELTISSLADAVALNIPAVSKIIDRLEGLGAVTRASNDSDQRKVSVGISPAGRRLKESFGPRVAECEREIARRLGSWEVERLHKLLARYLRSTEA
jgi:MarR family transcriptional regulator, organic hydroperoxide resistance regulator